MPSLPAAMLHSLIKSRMEKVNLALASASTVEEKVAVFRKEIALDVASRIYGHYRAEEDVLGGRPATWINHRKFPADRAVLFLHGGGYIGGSVYYSRTQASDVAKATGRRVVSLEYRLAPEHPYPAALEDLLAAYRELLARGLAPGAISLVGLSAGGGLAIAGVLAMMRENLPLPGSVVGLSPWCDLTLGQITIEANSGKDIMISKPLLEIASELYTAGHERADPLISPVFGDLRGFPPLLIQVAAEELLLGEAIEIANHAAKAGVKVRLDIFDGMWHVWQSLHELVPEARAALDIVGGFIRDNTVL